MYSCLGSEICSIGLQNKHSKNMVCKKLHQAQFDKCPFWIFEPFFLSIIPDKNGGDFKWTNRLICFCAILKIICATISAISNTIFLKQMMSMYGKYEK